MAGLPQPNDSKGLTSASWDVIHRMEAGAISPRQAQEWADAQAHLGKNAGLLMLRSRITKAIDLGPLLDRIRGKKTIRLQSVRQPNKEWIIHRSTRGASQKPWQVTTFFDDVPWGHVMHSSPEAAISDLWDEWGPVKMLMAESMDTVRKLMREYGDLKRTWKTLKLPPHVERHASGQHTPRAEELRAATAFKRAEDVAARFVDVLTDLAIAGAEFPADVDEFYAGLDDDLRHFRGELTRYNRSILADLDLVEMNERGRYVSLTAGMANVTQRGRMSDRSCVGCGLGFPVYPGRYPAECPKCGGTVERKVVREGEDGADSCGVFIRLPERIAKQFPNKDEDDSPPHITVLFVGRLSAERAGDLLDAVRRGVEGFPAFDIEVTDYGEFVSDTGLVISHMIPRSREPHGVATGLTYLHRTVLDAVRATGIDIQAHPMFKPHVTLAYRKAEDGPYDGPRPQGAWTCSGVEVWVGDSRTRLPFSGTPEVVERADALPGGKGDKLKPSDVDPGELAKGIKVEMEHTKDPALAMEIALDHLAEDPAYYTKLATIHTEEDPKEAGGTVGSVSFDIAPSESVPIRSAIPRLQRLIDAGTPGEARAMCSPLLTVPLSVVEDGISGGVRGMMWFLEGPAPTSPQRYYRIEGVEDPVLVFEFDEAAAQLRVFATRAPSEYLGSDPRADLIAESRVSSAVRSIIQGMILDGDGESSKVRALAKGLRAAADRNDPAQQVAVAAARLADALDAEGATGSAANELRDLVDQMGFNPYRVAEAAEAGVSGDGLAAGDWDALNDWWFDHSGWEGDGELDYADDDAHGNGPTYLWALTVGRVADDLGRPLSGRYPRGLVVFAQPDISFVEFAAVGSSLDRDLRKRMKSIAKTGRHEGVVSEVRRPYPGDECETCGHERDEHDGSARTTRTSGDGGPCAGERGRGGCSCLEFVPVEWWGYDDGRKESVAEADDAIERLARQAKTTGDAADIAAWRHASNRAGRPLPGEQFYSVIVRDAVKSLEQAAGALRDASNELSGMAFNAADVIERQAAALGQAAARAASRLDRGRQRMPRVSMAAAHRAVTVHGNNWQFLMSQASDAVGNAASIMRGIARDMERNSYPARATWDTVGWLADLASAISHSRDPLGGHHDSRAWRSPMPIPEDHRGPVGITNIEEKPDGAGGAVSSPKEPGAGNTRIHGGHRFEIGYNKKRKPRKNVELSIQNRLNARRGLAARIRAAKKWHRSHKGGQLHRDLAKYNKGNSRSEAFWDEIIPMALSEVEYVLRDDPAPGTTVVVYDYREPRQTTLRHAVATGMDPGDIIVKGIVSRAQAIRAAKREAAARGGLPVYFRATPERWELVEAVVAEDFGETDRTIDDVLDAILRRLITIESTDVLQDVEFADDGAIYLFFDPILTAKEVDEILQTIRQEAEKLQLVGSPDKSLPGEDVKSDWWVVYVPPSGDAVARPDPRVYAAETPPPGATAPQQMVVMAAPSSVDQVALSVDIDKLIAAVGKAAPARPEPPQAPAQPGAPPAAEGRVIPLWVPRGGREFAMRGEGEVLGLLAAASSGRGRLFLIREGSYDAAVRRTTRDLRHPVQGVATNLGDPESYLRSLRSSGGVQ